LDDRGALRYNPSTGTLLVPNLVVAGTTTQVDTVTMNAANAVVFEGATADAYETTLTITDPTADRTITLPNVTGTVALTSSNITGSAATLTTARTIGGTSFDGSANIDVALATLATTVTITDNESTNENNALIFTAGGDIDGGNLGLESDGTLTYNPSTGKVTATGFVGTLTGNVTGNTSGTAATVTGAAQTNITSLGTLTALTVDNIIVNGTNIGHTSDTDSIAIAADGVVTFSQIPVLPANSIDSDYYVDGSIDTAHIADNQITLAKMAGLARGKIIVGDASGDPSVLALGTNGQVLASDGTDLAFADISVSSLAADNLSAGDAAILLTTSSGNITIDAAANDSDIIIKGTDGSADTTYLTIDGSAAGEATFNAGIVIADAGTIGSASDKDAIAIASNGVVTFSQIPVMPANSIDSDEYIDGSIDTAHIADNQITLAKMAGIARGKIIYGDASGNPAVLAPGTNAQVLSTDGTDISWADSSGGGSGVSTGKSIAMAIVFG
jgi:hypothetical protein